jgi:formaldehyde-activating enzyme involved in methanogenesis
MPEKDERKEDGVTDPGAVLIGERFIGHGAEAAHINTVLGHRSGPVGTAWARRPGSPAADGLLPAMADVLAARATLYNQHYQAR